MQSALIRQAFLDFFEQKKHTIVPSAPMVIKDDPTLMFTNAGMNQFKDIFLGYKPATATRIADSQKCLRVSGKHNDLEEVGRDTYHHTMFEMLGNWSFGDYFKREAIEWAYEFLVEKLGINKDQVYVTVFEGDAKEGLESDQEALDIWSEKFPEAQILYGNKKDNFWEMGDQGPCGPCSEIHVDIRNPEERLKTKGSDWVNKDHPQVIEIWNLVFIQYNRKADGSLELLPQKHVDTGMGFERLCMVMQGKQSNYDTDVFQPMIQQLAALAQKKYGENERTDIALRVVADHIRAISFSIADGQLPSNNKAGYVIRRILRRAIRYGYTFLGFEKPFIYSLVPVLVDQMGMAYPELIRNKELIVNVIKSEEESFLHTLSNGLSLLSKQIDTLKQSGNAKLPGSIAFELYDTYGFPLDLTQLILSENLLEVDLQAFDHEMQKQKERSRMDAAKVTGDWVIIDDATESTFVGYNAISSQVRILKYRKQVVKNKDVYQMVFDFTPFYAESGGQVGDSGFIKNDHETVEIFDTQKENNLWVHFSNQLPTNLEGVFEAQVNAGRRTQIANNHSATHLLHLALRQVIGNHVEQKGSLVNEKGLRFDFSHFQKLSDEEIYQVEALVNQQIRMNTTAEVFVNLPISKATEMGAMALFGEKYGNEVRVVKFGNSVELCGGTHVASTGQIGQLIIRQETSIAAGIRRIEAITADAAETFNIEQRKLIEGLKERFKNQTDLVKSIDALLLQNKELSRKMESLHEQNLMQLAQDFKSKMISIGQYATLILRCDLDMDSLKKIAYKLTNDLENSIVVLGGIYEGKPSICVALSANVVEHNKLNASNMVRELAKTIQGGGGGQPHLATAGGKNADGMDQVFSLAKQLLSQQI